MIGLNGYMPVSCLSCRINHLITTNENGYYDVVCFAPKFSGQTEVISWAVPINTRPKDCPLIDLSRYEDDLK